MQRSRIGLSLAFGGALALGLAFARPLQDQVTIKSEVVAGPVAVLFGEGGNIGVSAGPDGILIVDDEFERLAKPIQAALDKLAKDPARTTPRFLVNTHHHGDHTDGNKHFGKSAVVVAHENVRARLLDEKAPAQALPIVTYADGISLHWNGEEIRLLHLPECHTDGDTVVWFKNSGVIHLGDLYFQLGYPFIDTASGGNVLGLTEGLKRLMAELPEGIRIIPGHGVVTGKKELAEYLKMLETITERVKPLLAADKDAKAMIASGVTKDFDERWGHFDFVPPEKFVQSVIDSLR
jgi:glyoxylase-like metal-dependent hydrolase (beta-lactamase superfamily II)